MENGDRSEVSFSNNLRKNIEKWHSVLKNNFRSSLNLVTRMLNFRTFPIENNVNEPFLYSHFISIRFRKSYGLPYFSTPPLTTHLLLVVFGWQHVFQTVTGPLMSSFYWTHVTVMVRNAKCPIWVMIFDLSVWTLVSAWYKPTVAIANHFHA